MNRLKSIANKILHPRMAVIVLLTPLSAAALIVTFAAGWDATAFGYIAYVLSGYVMAVTIINWNSMIERAKASVQSGKAWSSAQSFLYEHEHSRRFITDTPYRIRIFLFSSLTMNLLYAAFKLVAGIRYASFWYGADAIYYTVLCVARIVLTRHMQKGGYEPAGEYRVYRACGILLFALNAALTGVVYQIIEQNMGYSYPGLLIYVVAAYTFVNITTATVSLIRFRKLNSPILSAVKAINLAKAMVSMFALQSAMFASFGNGSEEVEQIMNVIFGSVLCIAVFAIAVSMVVRANKNLKRLGRTAE